MVDNFEFLAIGSIIGAAILYIFFGNKTPATSTAPLSQTQSFSATTRSYPGCGCKGNVVNANRVHN